MNTTVNISLCLMSRCKWLIPCELVGLCKQFINPLSVIPIYVRNPHFIWDLHPIITVPADGLAPHGARPRPSAGSVMTGPVNILWMKLFGQRWCQAIIFWLDDVIQNSRWDLEKSLGTLSVYLKVPYNMVCSALFLQRALYTVHCTDIMHSRKPSLVITPAVFS